MPDKPWEETIKEIAASDYKDEEKAFMVKITAHNRAYKTLPDRHKNIYDYRYNDVLTYYLKAKEFYGKKM